jgi:hypothetical protein
VHKILGHIGGLKEAVALLLIPVISFLHEWRFKDGRVGVEGDEHAAERLTELHVTLLTGALLPRESDDALHNGVLHVGGAAEVLAEDADAKVPEWMESRGVGGGIGGVLLGDGGLLLEDEGTVEVLEKELDELELVTEVRPAGSGGVEKFKLAASASEL